MPLELAGLLFRREFGFLQFTVRSARFNLGALERVVGCLRKRDRRGKRQYQYKQLKSHGAPPSLTLLRQSNLMPSFCTNVR